MPRILRFTLTAILLTSPARPQEIHPSIHETESAFYAAHPEKIARLFPKAAKDAELQKAASLSNVVYGFHPYWQDGAESNYYFSLLTHLAYFSGDIDPATGGFSSTYSWSSANVVTEAQKWGVKVHFCVTLFSSHATLLNNNTSRQNLINNIISQINLRGADGCNVDFESMSTSVADSFRTFIYQLGTALEGQGKELAVELPAVDWSTGGVMFGTTFFAATSSVVDYYFLMAYDYYWSGSANAGPVAPLTTGTSSYHVMRSINTYLSKGAPASKLIAGFPYYGYDWPVTSNTRMAATTGTGRSRTYSVIKTNYIDTIALGNQFFDATYNTPWYRYQPSGSWRQCWYDDSTSLAMKYDSVKARSLAGTGMWALGYDGTYTELWRLLKTKFASQPNPAFTILDDFESSVGHFNRTPTWSGSTAGISAASAASWTNDAANDGLGSLTVVLKDSTAISTAWTVRLLSGSGSRSSNVPLSSTGYIGLWLKTSSAPSGSQVAVTIDDRSTETELSSRQTVLNDGQWHLYQWNMTGGGWTSFAGGNGALDSSVVSLDAIMFYAPNTASDWSLWVDDVAHNPSGPLPVQLLTFRATASGTGALLQWTTAAEVNCYGFEVERRTVTGGSAMPGDWVRVGFVEGSGTSASPHEYSYTDAGLFPGRYVYRIKQIDRTGAVRYYGDAEVEILGVPNTLMLTDNYPNPFNPSTTVRFTVGSDGRAVLKVLNAIGQQIAELFNGQATAGRYYEVQFAGNSLSSGIYYCSLESNGRRVVKKMVLLK